MKVVIDTGEIEIVLCRHEGVSDGGGTPTTSLIVHPLPQSTCVSSSRHTHALEVNFLALSLHVLHNSLSLPQ